MKFIKDLLGITRLEKKIEVKDEQVRRLTQGLITVISLVKKSNLSPEDREHLENASAMVRSIPILAGSPASPPVWITPAGQES
jgi:hypothetical protein